MSRSKKGKKAPGYEYWSSRPGSGSGYGPTAKKITKRRERALDRVLEHKAKYDRNEK